MKSTAIDFTNMVFVEGGTFEMFTDHYVALPNYYIGKHPVSIKMFAFFIEDTGYITDADKKGSSPSYVRNKIQEKKGANWKCGIYGNPRKKYEYNHPVTHVSWNDAVAYCEWLSQTHKKNYRLPTEAEWQFAAQGGNKSKGYIYSGSNNATDIGWSWNNSGIQIMQGEWNNVSEALHNRCDTHPVGQLKPNELGIYDMSGNVDEWCFDWENGIPSEYCRLSTKQLDFKTFRPCRGGCFINGTMRTLKVKNRDGSPLFLHNFRTGFRIVLDLN